MDKLTSRWINTTNWSICSKLQAVINYLNRIAEHWCWFFRRIFVSRRGLFECKRKEALIRVDSHGVMLHGTTVVGSMIGIAHRGSPIESFKRTYQRSLTLCFGSRPSFSRLYSFRSARLTLDGPLYASTAKLLDAITISIAILRIYLLLSKKPQMWTKREFLLNVYEARKFWKEEREKEQVKLWSLWDFRV